MSEVDDILAYCGTDNERLHDAYAAELARPRGAQRQPLLAKLRARLHWPLPDTPPAEVLGERVGGRQLRGAGSPGIPVARALAIEEGRPARYQRPALIAELRRRAAALGANASALAPAQPQASTEDGGVLRS